MAAEVGTVAGGRGSDRADGVLDWALRTESRVVGDSAATGVTDFVRCRDRCSRERSVRGGHSAIAVEGSESTARDSHHRNPLLHRACFPCVAGPENYAS